MPSYLINDGARSNRAQPGSPGSYEEQGVIVDMVGCRFEVPGKMEWRHMIVTQQQNTPANGYGSRFHTAFKNDEKLELFSALYRTAFPTYEEAREAKAREGSRWWARADEGRGVPAAALLNVAAFEARYTLQGLAKLLGARGGRVLLSGGGLRHGALVADCTRAGAVAAARLQDGAQETCRCLG